MQFESFREYERWKELQRFEPYIFEMTRKERKMRAQMLKLFWYSINAPSIDSCWRMCINKDFLRTPKECRDIYIRFKGPIPDGMELHHKCCNKWCVNPRHLQPLTFSDHLAAHGKNQKVKFRAQNKYQRMVRELLEVKQKEATQLNLDQSDIEIDQV